MNPADDQIRPRLLAFIHSNEDDEDQRIVFAVSQAAARAEHSGPDSLVSDRINRSPAFDRFAPGPVPVSATLDEGWYAYCASHTCSRRICYDDHCWAEPGRDPHIGAEAAQVARRERDESRWLLDNPEPEDAPADAEWAVRNRTRIAQEEWREAHSRALPPLDPPLLDRAALRFDGPHVYCSLSCQRAEALDIARTDLRHADAEEEASRRWPGCTSYTSGRWPQMEPRVRFRPDGFEHDVNWHVAEDQPYVMPVDLPAWRSMTEDMEERSVKS
jgi:hypothetical protein